MTALLQHDAPAILPDPAPKPDPWLPAEPIPPYPPRPQTVDIPDVFTCAAEAAHRIGNGEAADYACGRHRFEVVAAHYKRETNLPIYDLPEGNGHVCNEVRLRDEEATS